jgi:hypothetical protein
MSAPRTNIETQSRWHRAPLIGMVAAVVFALGLLFWQMMMTVPDATPPAGDPPTIPDGDLPAPSLPEPAPDIPTSPIAPPESSAP